MNATVSPETKREGAAEESFAVAAPTLSLPKGGGAIKGIGEKFGANPVTGTGSMSVPLAVSPGRAGFGPQLALSYDSGAGNGPFGMGWNLPLPAITRKTEKGLPQYRDAEESDVFLMSDAEDLVPILERGANGWERQQLPICTVGGIRFRIDRYRPRIEGLFACVERWSNLSDRTDVRWRSISKENVTTWYGIDAASRIADPSDLGRIFSWRISRTHDDKGNVVVYEYVSDDAQGVDTTQVHEVTRRPSVRETNRYLRGVRYGNRTPWFPDYTARVDGAPLPAEGDWMFSVVFDYDEGRYEAASLPGDDPALVRAAFAPKTPQSGWPVRRDPFSSCRSGFEVRTYRLCRRALMFHHFAAELNTAACLVRSTEFNYEEAAVGSFIKAVTQSGYVRVAGPDLAHRGDLYRKRSMPPAEFEYSKAEISSEIRDVDASSLENLPVGLDGSAYQWVDLDGEGLSGILAEQNGAWYYKRNLSALPQPTTAGREEVRAHFAPVDRVERLPAVAGGGHHRLLDLAGDGSLDVVDLGGPAPGFYERTDDGTWAPFTTFRSLPSGARDDSRWRFIDLTGDGRADILITDDNVFTYHASLGEEGFDAAKTISQSFDADAGPRLVATDATVLIGVADMSGDGLADLVRVANGEVCYWPNLGYGRFGPKVTLENSPWFDLPDQFDPNRLRLADIDGSGTTDLIYLGRGRVTIHRNLSGNRFAEAEPLYHFPPVDNHTAVQTCDLLGNGTACLVWSSPLPADGSRAMRYVDLMGGQKPHLLVTMRNNLGAETTIEYAPSTQFYLADKLAGRPWITKLPFPVHCVQKVTVTDKWRHTKFSTNYSYHHGYFDGIEREFRGFGRVEQVDVESYGKSASYAAESPYVTTDHTLYQPPVKTISWFHTGAAIDRERILRQFENEFFPRSLAAVPSSIAIDAVFTEKSLPEPDLASLNLSSEEWREALRACKGMLLRQEIYELDVDALQTADSRLSRQTPVRLFSAVTHACRIRCLQPRGENPYAVFLAGESESVSYHYELDLRPSPPLPGATTSPPLAPDPRIAHSLALSFDDYGNVQQSVAVAYARQRSFADAALGDHADLIREVQREQHVSYTETHYTSDAIDSPAAGVPRQYHRLRLPYEVQTFELTGFTPARGVYFELNDFRSCDLSAEYPAPAPAQAVARKRYHELPQTMARAMRSVEHTRTLFWKDDLSDSLDLGELGSLGLVHENYKLALTQSLLDAIFDDGQLDKNLPVAGTVRDALNAWRTSGYLSDAAATTKFGRPAAGEYWARSGFAGFEADADQHFYLAEKFTDAFGRLTTLQYDADDLFVTSRHDELGNASSVEQFDYRVLVPAKLKDVNGNITAAAFDTLGFPVAFATQGKLGTESGDNLAGLRLDLPAAEVEDFLVSDYDETVATDWLGEATSRFVCDFGFSVGPGGVVSYCDRPPAAFAVVRETHVATGAAAKIQSTVEYSDGAGAVFVKKTQAEPDPQSTLADPPLRWIASGKTVLNNKGKPVKQYEPYFSLTDHCFNVAESENAAGVTPLMYYDAIGRLVRTELPDGTLSRIEFSPWFRRNFDANDTVLESTWYQTRNQLNPATSLVRDINGTVNATPESRAGWLTARHANTPAQTHLDSLGRDVVAIVHNRVEDAAGPWQFDGRKWRDDFTLTFTRLDAEGKPLWVRDARGNLAMQYLWPAKPDRDEPRVARDFSAAGNPNNDIGARTPGYDIAGNLLFHRSMDGGNRWQINDVAGQPMAAWDFNEHEEAGARFDHERLHVTEYDALHRPTAVWRRIWERPTPAPMAAVQPYVERAAEMIVRYEYQDGLLADPANLNNQCVRRYDPGGLTETVKRDFQGGVLEQRRRLNNQPTKSSIDWQGALATLNAKLEAETFTEISEFDALSRMTRRYNWHRDPASVAVYEPKYNQRGMLESEKLRVRASRTAAGPTGGANAGSPDEVREIRYNVRGQKEFLLSGNGALVQCDYDPVTFRLLQIRTTRPADKDDFPARRSNLVDPAIVQQLLYTYDPIGNVTEIEDQAFEPVFFDQGVAEPKSQYEYDALYRLTWASGRETAEGGQGASDGDEPAFGNGFPVTDQTLRRYIETYEYDAAGNFVRKQHTVPTDTAASWTRNFECRPDNNQLWRSWTGTRDWAHTAASKRTEYTQDTHGNTLNLADAGARSNLEWDGHDMLRRVNLGGGGQAYYQYDDARQRTRKWLEREITAPDGSRQWVKHWERIYLGGYELYRRYDSSGVRVEEIESHPLFEGAQRVLLVEDVLETDRQHADGTAFQEAPVFRYQYGNHLGSAVLELDDQAAVISYEEFHPYGTSAYRAAASDGEAPPQRYRFTGMERDEESGLSYHGARYFLPWLGRWMSCDPSGVADGNNVFLYGHANPVGLVDPNGRQSQPTTSYQSRGAGGVCSTCHDPLLPTPANRTRAIAEEWRMIAAAQVAYDAEYDRIYAEEKATNPYGGMGSGVAPDDPIPARIVARIGARPQQPGVKAIKDFFTFGFVAVQVFLLKKMPAPTPAGPAPLIYSEAASLARAEATMMNIREVPNATRVLSAATGEEIFMHTTGRAGMPFTGPTAAMAIEETETMRLSTAGGFTGQWGEGVYAYESAAAGLPAGGPMVQFRVPPGTAIETITVPGARPIVRLVPPEGMTLRVVNPATNLTAEQVAANMEHYNMLRAAGLIERPPPILPLPAANQSVSKLPNYILLLRTMQEEENQSKQSN